MVTREAGRPHNGPVLTDAQTRRLGIFLAFFLLSALWCFLVGWADRGDMIRRVGGPSHECLNEHLPEGTIHTPEGGPYPPRGTYSFLPPLGYECAFEMVDGSTVRSFHPDTGATLIGVTPMIYSLSYGLWALHRYRTEEQR